MDFKALFESLPDLLKLFVPGFVFIKTLCFFGKSKSDSFEGTAVASVTISYILNLAVGLLAKVIDILDFKDIFTVHIFVLLRVKSAPLMMQYFPIL